MRRVVAAVCGALVLATGMAVTGGTALAASPDRGWVNCGPYTHWMRGVGCVANGPTLWRPGYRYHPYPRYVAPWRHYAPPHHYYPLNHHPVRNHA